MPHTLAHILLSWGCSLKQNHRQKNHQGYGICFLLIFLFSTIVVACTLRMMTSFSMPNTLIAYQDRFNAENIITTAFEQVREDILSKLNAGTTVDLTYRYPTSGSANATMPHDPNNLNGTQDTIGTWYATLLYQRGNYYTVKVTVSAGGANISHVQLMLLKGTPTHHYRTITIDHTKVPNTDQTNFPMFFSGTYSYLATVANGGKVTNSNGYDITFTSDAAGTQLLPFERESYNATTGQVVFWVQVPTVSHTGVPTDTTIYLHYGNSSITTDQSNKTGTWDTNYKAVWHLDATSGTTVSESTSSAATGTSTNTITGVTGEIGGSQSFNGTSDQDRVSSAAVNITGDKTVETWLNVGSFSTPADNTTRKPLTVNIDGTNAYIIFVNDGTTKSCGAGGQGIEFVGDDSAGEHGSCWRNGGSGAATNTWYHVVGTYTASSHSISLYINGTLNTDSGIQTSISKGTTGAMIGSRVDNQSYYQGYIDEMRISNIVRSADWIKTEYNNQSTPDKATFGASGFYTLGAEQ